MGRLTDKLNAINQQQGQPTGNGRLSRKLAAEAQQKQKKFDLLSDMNSKDKAESDKASKFLNNPIAQFGGALADIIVRPAAQVIPTIGELGSMARKGSFLVPSLVPDKTTIPGPAYQEPMQGYFSKAQEAALKAEKEGGNIPLAVGGEMLDPLGLLPVAATEKLMKPVSKLVEKTWIPKMINNRITKKAETKTESLAGSIAQGKADDIQKSKSALSFIDTKGVKTYDDLSKKTTQEIENLSNKLDQTLAADPTPHRLQDLNFSESVGGKGIKHNYIEDAFNHLDELYTKINDPISKAEIYQLRNKAMNEGLTVEELNKLAKVYGNEFKGKAFTKMGEPATSISGQAVENTRTGIKNTAKSLFKNPIFDEADKQLSDMIRLRDLSDDMVEKVNDLKQRVAKRGFGEAAGRKLGQLADLLTFHTVGGALRSLIIPRGGGLKMENAIDLEKSLQKKLVEYKKLDAVLNSSMSEEKIISKMDEIINSLNKERSNRLLLEAPEGIPMKGPADTSGIIRKAAPGQKMLQQEYLLPAPKGTPMPGWKGGTAGKIKTPGKGQQYGEPWPPK